MPSAYQIDVPEQWRKGQNTINGAGGVSEFNVNFVKTNSGIPQPPQQGPFDFHMTLWVCAIRNG